MIAEVSPKAKACGRFSQIAQTLTRREKPKTNWKERIGIHADVERSKRCETLESILSVNGSMAKLLRRFRRDESGSYLLMASLMMPVLVGLVRSWHGIRSVDVQAPNNAEYCRFRGL